MVKKLLTAIGVVIVVIWIVNNPAGAAADVHKFFAALTVLASAI